MKQRSSKRPTPYRFKFWSYNPITIVLISLLILAAGSYFAYRISLRPVASTGDAQTFTVSSGQNAQTIATNLKKANLVRSRDAFITYVNFHGLRPKLKTGTYSLKPSYSTPEIAQIIGGGKTLTKRLVIPEGYTLKQIEAAAAKQGITRADFVAALNAPHAQSFLSAKPANVSLEGYLYPDSYEISPTTTAAQLVDIMLNTFGSRVPATYTQAFAAQGLTLHQGLTLASIVEREVNIVADRPVVAQIFLKRFKAGQSLGSDVTTIYASDLAGVPFNLDINSPYNTRKFTGLPPGPICSPGLSALDAVARPATTDYTYFLSGKDGKTYYAKTYAEHQRNIVNYLE
jgi:UPF0755 protein